MLNLHEAIVSVHDDDGRTSGRNWNFADRVHKFCHHELPQLSLLGWALLFSLPIRQINYERTDKDIRSYKKNTWNIELWLPGERGEEKKRRESFPFHNIERIMLRFLSDFASSPTISSGLNDIEGETEREESGERDKTHGKSFGKLLFFLFWCLNSRIQANMCTHWRCGKIE